VFSIGWLIVNSGKIPRAQPFDPYPFSLLGVIVAVEAVILSSFILMRQNRMMRRGERRDHLNLQVDLLAEKEITKLLQMVRALCGHMGLQNIMADKEIRDLSQNTSIESLSQTWPSTQLVDRTALTPDENHFAMLRTGEMGVDWVPFLKSKRRFRIRRVTCGNFSCCYLPAR